MPRRMRNITENPHVAYLLIKRSSRNQIHPTRLEQGGANSPTKERNQEKSNTTTTAQVPDNQPTVHGSKDCTVAVAMGILLKTGFAVGYTRGTALAAHFLQALPQGFPLRTGLLVLELVVIKLLHALSEKSRIMIREDLAHIQRQAPDSLVPVTPGISLERRKDDG